MTTRFHSPSWLALGAAVLCLNALAAPQQGKRELRLTDVAAALQPGAPVGVVESGPDCASSATREWSDLLARRVDAELPKAFDEEVAKAGFATHKLTGAAGAELDVKAVVDALQVHVCDLGKGAWRGSFSVQVAWQLTRPGVGQPRHVVSTSGAFERLSADKPLGAAAGLHQALAASVRALIADQRLQALLQPGAAAGRKLAAVARD